MKSITPRSTHSLHNVPTATGPAPATPSLRRYPSLADDAQPWFPRDHWSRRALATALFAPPRPSVFPVRLVALALLIVIFALLAANS